ncbi:unnamed protein product, partial [Prorocentrum cordatum]
ELLTRPALSLPSELKWSASPPRAKLSVERVEYRGAIAAEPVDLGLPAPMPSEWIFQVPGRELTNGLFAVAMSGTPDVFPWNWDYQKSAIFMHHLPAPCSGCITACTPVPGRVLELAAKEVWLAMAILPMVWVHRVPIFQSIHRRVALIKVAAGANVPPAREWRRGRLASAAVAAPLAGDGSRDRWSTYIDDFDHGEALDWRAAVPLMGSAITISKNKANQRQAPVTRMGVEVDGSQVGPLTTGPITCSCMASPRGSLPVTIPWFPLMDRWVRPLEFRRSLFGVPKAIWEQMGSGRTLPTSGSLDELAHGRLPLPHAPTNLRAMAAGIASCSDASGGDADRCAAAGVAEGAADLRASLSDPRLGATASRATQAGASPGCRMPQDFEPDSAKDEPRILRDSLFDGIGGAIASPVRSGFVIGGYLRSEIDE